MTRLVSNEKEGVIGGDSPNDPPKTPLSPHDRKWGLLWLLSPPIDPLLDLCVKRERRCQAIPIALTKPNLKRDVITKFSFGAFRRPMAPAKPKPDSALHSPKAPNSPQIHFY